MKRLPLFALPLLALATPLAAQTVQPTQATTKVAEAPTADRVAAAKPVIDKLWPLGTYRKMMGSQMGEMIDAMMASMYDIKVEDMIPAKNIPEHEKGKSLGEITAVQDPHFRERMRIMMDVMFKEMTPIMDKAEPSIRSALTTAYARQYTAAQLTDINTFLGTPTGQVYSQNWISSFYTPEIMTSMKDFMPELVAAIPDIMEKVEKATAHLPLPGSSAKDKEADAIAAASEEADPQAKWSQADRDLNLKLSNEALLLSDKYDTANARYELHTLEAKERAGQKLTESEIEQRDFLREHLKDKK